MENASNKNKYSLTEMVTKNKKNIIICAIALPIVIVIYLLVYQMFNFI